MKKRFKAPVLLLLCVLLLTAAAGGLCAETPKGYVRIYGYKEEIPDKGKRFAPRAVLEDVPSTRGMDLYLTYVYQKFSRTSRCWQLKVVDANGQYVEYPGNLTVYLPYPSIWSTKYQDYWKWTKAYAQRFDWYYAKGYSSLYYYFSSDAVAVAGGFSGRRYYSIEPTDAFGFAIPMYHGMTKKSVMLFNDAGHWSHGTLSLSFDHREPEAIRDKPLDELLGITVN